jgi:hypothetical protein
MLHRNETSLVGGDGARAVFAVLGLRPSAAWHVKKRAGKFYRMVALVRIALRRPYTFVVLALLILLAGSLAAVRTPIDIFPEIRIPIIAAIW